MDVSGKRICAEAAAEFIHDMGRDLIIKQSIYSSCGNGVCMIRNGMNRGEILSLLKSYDYDFVVQDIVKQSPVTARLNPTSLNCMRITTYTDREGNTYISNRTVKAGGEGQSVDNIGGGRGGVMIGIDEQGCLSKYGYNHLGQSFDRWNDVIFSGYKIPEMSKVDEFACECAQRIPACRIVGFDIALDENNKPVLIEANMSWPGITIEQQAAGPIVGDHIIDLITEFKQSK